MLVGAVTFLKSTIIFFVFWVVQLQVVAVAPVGVPHSSLEISPMRKASSANLISFMDWWLEAQQMVYGDKSQWSSTQLWGAPVMMVLVSKTVFNSHIWPPVYLEVCDPPAEGVRHIVQRLVCPGVELTEWSGRQSWSPQTGCWQSFLRSPYAAMWNGRPSTDLLAL